jgi:hypothetical protein
LRSGWLSRCRPAATLLRRVEGRDRRCRRGPQGRRLSMTATCHCPLREDAQPRPTTAQHPYPQVWQFLIGHASAPYARPGGPRQRVAIRRPHRRVHEQWPLSVLNADNTCEPMKARWHGLLSAQSTSEVAAYLESLPASAACLLDACFCSIMSACGSHPSGIRCPQPRCVPLGGARCCRG